MSQKHFGLIPVSLQEALPEPSSVELAKEAEQEAAVFAQSANVDKLLTMLRALDPANDNLADNEEIQVTFCAPSPLVALSRFE
jgi:signal transducing adaptor molecule